jgi:hypothetical protein
MPESWSWWDPSKRYPAIPQPVQNIIDMKWPHVKLHILGYPWPCRISRRPTDVESYNTFTIPLKNIAHLSTVLPGMGWGRDLQSHNLESVIAGSHNLETLELAGASLFPSRLARFPPIKHLSIKGWIDKYTKEQMQQLWDFSKLKSLTFKGPGGLASFLEALPRDSLPRLKKLILDGETNPALLEDLTPHVNHLLDQASEMEEIDIRCNLHLLSMESILKHGSHLRILRIQDISDFWDGSRTYGHPLYRALSVADLTRIRDCCPRLKDMSLDLDGSEHGVGLQQALGRKILSYNFA